MQHDFTAIRYEGNYSVVTALFCRSLFMKWDEYRKSGEINVTLLHPVLIATALICARLRYAQPAHGPGVRGSGTAIPVSDQSHKLISPHWPEEGPIQASTNCIRLDTRVEHRRNFHAGGKTTSLTQLAGYNHYTTTSPTSNRGGGWHSIQGLHLSHGTEHNVIGRDNLRERILSHVSDLVNPGIGRPLYHCTFSLILFCSLLTCV
ncbi:hypothetical protein WA026_009301 [Henosepilachna vigintioctopunctata]|uniref:Uncharacterized protein n=1 Tax=Henosepilachna vigintioctopunctata TaxID=420089 RepID=A0AAW1UVF2_9CUCU